MMIDKGNRLEIVKFLFLYFVGREFNKNINKLCGNDKNHKSNLILHF